MPLATVFISSSGAVRPCATNWVISSVAITEKTVMKRSSVSVRRATSSSPVVMKTETTTRVPSLVLIEMAMEAERSRLRQSGSVRSGRAAGPQPPSHGAGVSSA